MKYMPESRIHKNTNDGRKPSTIKERFMSISKTRLFSNCLTRFKPQHSAAPLLGLKSVALIGMGFSANNIKDPGRAPGTSNEEIAAIIAELWDIALKQGIQTLVLPQREVAEALEIGYPNIPIACILKEVGEEKHISSHDILRQAWNFASVRNVTDAIVCAHYRHALRATWNAEMYGFKVRYPHRYAMTYARESTQLHTKNAPLFFVWELLSRAKLVLVDKP